MSAFGDNPARRISGTIFSAKDQFILKTLFYPFRVRFGYQKANEALFEQNLQKIRPLFDDLLDFEKVMLENSTVDLAPFKQSSAYLILRASFIERWSVLNDCKDYPHMLSPLAISNR